jgi:hypothetical protein
VANDNNVPIGIGPPNALPVTIRQGASTVDLTTVTGVTLNVTREIDGSTTTWVCVIDSSGVDGVNGQTYLTCHYPFAAYTPPALGDVSVLGTYDLAPVLTVPAGGTGIPCYSFEICATLPGQTPKRNP